MMDYSRLRLKRSPNQYLVAPPGITADPPHRPAPVFDMPVEKLAAQFRAYALNQPRVTLIGVSIDGRDLELVQRSKVFRFPDRISVRFLPLALNKSTVIVYSRAKYGYRDFGVNRMRIDAWLAALGAPTS
ncbi:MAG: DUF1499 domain-containing protein [Rhodospirillales bacterium]